MDHASATPERRVSHYRVLGPLGAGGMGEVYAAFDETLKRRVALKSIRAEHRLDAESKARFVREARLLSQLDHPNVCRVYDYIEEGDSGWLVLELIEGRNLRDLIAGALDTPRKMRMAEQIAAVLVATHAAGVMHRDLKPGNVMITSGGDVKVLDFGLAQPVGPFDAGSSVATRSPIASQDLPSTDAEETHAASARAASLDGGHTFGEQSVFRTQAGAVSGTVAYMSPEQAMGSQATTASDMYSFGLLLQELFTGNRPYDSTLSPAELLERVRRADTPAPHGIATDLALLIGRLKSAAPSQRPTAVEALERLRWIRDKPARRLRRLAVAGIVTALVLGAAKYTFDLARERTVAVAARADADQRRKQAESLIGFMLGDLRTKLQQLGRLELLEDVGREATAYFKAVPTEALSDQELYRRSQALYQIGQVYQAKGSLAPAADAYRDSLSLITQVAARAPDNSDWQLGLGTAHFYLGDALRRQGDLDGALAHYRSYWQIAERLLARAPNNPAWKLEVSFGHSNVAAVLESKGDITGALAELETTLALKQQVSDSDPSNIEWRRTLASTYNRLGVVLQKLGQLGRARDSYRRNLEIQQALLARSPNNAQLQLGVSNAHAWLGTVLDDLGEGAEALRHHQARFAIESALVARDPSNTDWQRNLATARVRLGEADRQNGNPAAAQAKYRESVAVLTTLLQKNPTSVFLRRDVAGAYTGLARQLLSSGRAEPAAREAQACVAVLTPLLSTTATDREVLRYSIDCQLLLGAALAAEGRRTDATAQWARALAAVEPVASVSDDSAYLQLWARALRYVGRHAEAESVAEKIIARGYRHRAFLEAMGEKGGRTPAIVRDVSIK